jgi:thiamine biosynthesis lipoprotein
VRVQQQGTTEAAPPRVVRHAEQVMGTVVSFDLRPGDVPDAVVVQALSDAIAGLHRVDTVFSTWKPESSVSRLRRGELKLAQCPTDVARVLALCEEARDASQGWFDPWAMPGGVDPTGLVKGWAAERALDTLLAAGIPAAMVNAGGDIAVAGEPEPGRSWRIGVRDPVNLDDFTTVVPVSGRGAVATSGAYERGFHVLLPTTGQPAYGVLSATVVGPDLAIADALATGLVAGGQEAMGVFPQLPGYSCWLVLPGGGLLATADFPGLS